MKVKMLKRNPADFLRETKHDIHKLPRNYNPELHPLEEAREYQRALNAVKLERVFAKPFLGALSGHKDGVTGIALHPKRLSVVATAAADGEIRLWDLQTRKTKARLRGHGNNFAGGLCFANENSGCKLLTVGDDKKIHFWNADGLEEEEGADGDSVIRQPIDIFIGKVTFALDSF